MELDKHSQTWIWLIAIHLVLTLSDVHGQSNLYGVHIVPRGETEHSDPLLSLTKSSAGIIRTRVELVLVPVHCHGRLLLYGHWPRAGEFSSL